MTRTPTTIVTATAIAACAFAWSISNDAHDSGLPHGSPLISPQLS
jgi:hypothetical protein